MRHEAVVDEDGTGWWRSAVMYQLYPRSFADGNGDGVGDLAGVRARLDHLARLGVDAVTRGERTTRTRGGARAG